MTILDRLVGAMADMRLRAEAFETARQNMETLLSETSIANRSEYGTNEVVPEIQWQTVVEPFYEPISNKMWIRAVCSAGFNDSQGQYQSIDLEHWLTNLSASVVRQIIQQQQAEQDYLDLLSGTAAGQEEAMAQEATTAYLSEAGLDVDKYTAFLEQQRRNKLDYISKNGFDDGYTAAIDELRENENRFLQTLGMDFDKYNAFAQNYVAQSSAAEGAEGLDVGDGQTGDDRTPTADSTPSDSTGDSSGDTEPPPTTPETKKVYGPEDLPLNIPKELIPIFLQLMNS
jgi:hypothetical protein